MIKRSSMKIEPNSKVCVTLTKEGADIVNRWLNSTYTGGINEESRKYEDGDTFCHSLWYIMKLFGGDNMMADGSTPYFHSLKNFENEGN